MINMKHTQETKNNISKSRVGKTLKELGHKSNCSCFVCRAKRKEPLNHKIDCKCWVCNREMQKGENHPNWKGLTEVNCVYCNKIKKIKKCQEKQKNHFCNRECLYEYLRKNNMMRGNKNPSWKKKIIVNCEYCGKNFKLQPCMEKQKFCSRKCYQKAQSKYYVKEKSPAWKGGISFEPYPLGWNKTFKEQIRYRDRYTCQLCGMPEVECNRKLDVHHIDYDKKNLKSINLISLCHSCHMKTNGKRNYYIKYFKGK